MRSLFLSFWLPLLAREDAVAQLVRDIEDGPFFVDIEVNNDALDLVGPPIGLELKGSKVRFHGLLQVRSCQNFLQEAIDRLRHRVVALRETLRRLLRILFEFF